MKIVNISWLVFLFFLLTNCSIFHSKPDQKDEILFSEEIDKWNQFQMDGIIELNYKEYVFRKFFSAQKNEEVFRFDIIDSGFSGLKPTPFFSLYADSLVYLKTFPDFELTTYPLANYLSSLNLKKVIKYNPEINKEKQIIIDKLLIHFNDEMKIDFLQLPDFKITYIYNFKKELREILIEKENKKIATLQIDNMKKETGKILPLK